ncbi:MAG: 1-acyl-sn-glycerol-3-phosphate acyltransferase [Anaerolineae bacterium]|nr:1-acyl-sn-glycerol-3-phosphate acyltransferase [Anaerolineae bacterium]
MSASVSVEQYIARQPSLSWRRHILRGLIRWVGFGLLVKIKVNGLENIPSSGPALLMMNHVTALDPGLCMGAVTHRFVIPMTKIENTHTPLGALAVWWWGAYTVNRGEIDRKALTNSIELLKSGQLILIAPEGTRQKHGLARPKDGMAYVATKADAVVVPTAISGAEGWKEKWGRFQRPEITLTFGKPFRFRVGGRNRIPREELSEMTEEAMYQLATALPNPEARGVYSDLSKATARYLEFIDT